MCVLSFEKGCNIYLLDFPPISFHFLSFFLNLCFMLQALSYFNETRGKYFSHLLFHHPKGQYFTRVILPLQTPVNCLLYSIF